MQTLTDTKSKVALQEAHWRDALLLENISKVDSAQHLSSSELFPLSWSTEIKIFFSCFIVEKAALNHHLEAKAQAKREQGQKKKREENN